jgi:hypothetical protein
MSKRFIATALSAALTLAVIGGASAAAGQVQVSKSARKCHLSAHEQRHLGTSYVTSLRVANTGGAAGHCNHAVRKFHCSERRYDKLKHIQYDGTVTCKRGGKLVKSTYTQNI